MNAFVLSGLFLLVILFCLESIINNNIALSLLYSVEKYLFVVGWGTLGISDGQFDKPHEISVDPSGNVYVADTGNNRIQKFSSNGTFIAKWGTTCDLRLNVGCTNSSTLASSLLDEGDGQFNSPSSVAVNPSSGNVYVADTGNNRIEEFTSSGIFIKKWGSSGSADGEFIGPTGIAVSVSSGNVYVADYGNNRIQVFKRDGTFITVWGSSGFGAYQFNGPKSIAVDPSSGEVYVTDIFNNRIQSFDLAPTFTSK